MKRKWQKRKNRLKRRLFKNRVKYHPKADKQ